MCIVTEATKLAKELKRAQNIRKSLGIYTAAKYMANRGYSLSVALRVLLNTTVRA